MMAQAGFGSLDARPASTSASTTRFAGGYGGRSASDGPDAVQAHGQNTENAPIEETELNYPVRIPTLSLVEDSDGAGRFRGGLGLRKDYLFDRPDDVHDPRRPRQDRPGGGVRRRRRPQGGVRPDPRRRRVAPRVEDDRRPRARRRRQLPHVRRRRVRPAGGAGSGARRARRARGKGERRPCARRVPRRPRRRRGRRERDERAPEERMSSRLAIDIGGTFTDATLIDEETGAVSIAKVLSTPADPSLGFMAAAERILAESDVAAADVHFVVHATTVATNAIIEGTIARGGFVTTEGFRDLLEIQRQTRPTLYDTRFEKTPPLVPRDRAFGVRERLGPGGEVLTPLDEASVRDVAAALRDGRVESVAVCLLHCLRQPRARAARRRDPRGGAARRPDLALVGRRAGVPRVPARVDDGDQRGDPPGRRPLPREHRATSRGRGRLGGAARHAVERRRVRRRGRRAEARLHGRVRAGGRRHRVREPRQRDRERRRHLVRHGRHDGEGRADPGRDAVGHEGLLGRLARVGRRRRPLAVRVPDADAGDRPRRDRGGRRVDRLGRLRRHAPRRAAQRGRRPGAGLLPPGRHRADRDRRERRPRPPQPGVLPRRRDRARRRGRAARDRRALRRAARPRRRRGGERDRRDRERGDGERAPPDLRAARVRPAGLRARRLRRRRPGPRERHPARLRGADARRSRRRRGSSPRPACSGPT